MNRKELNKFNELIELQKNQEDITDDHPLLKEMNDKIQREVEILEPQRQKVKERISKMKNKKFMAQMQKLIEDANEEYKPMWREML